MKLPTKYRPQHGKTDGAPVKCNKVMHRRICRILADRNKHHLQRVKRARLRDQLPLQIEMQPIKKKFKGRLDRTVLPKTAMTMLWNHAKTYDKKLKAWKLRIESISHDRRWMIMYTGPRSIVINKRIFVNRPKLQLLWHLVLHAAAHALSGTMKHTSKKWAKAAKCVGCSIQVCQTPKYVLSCCDWSVKVHTRITGRCKTCGCTPNIQKN